MRRDNIDKRIMYYGTDDPIKTPLALRAGPLELSYDDGTIRSIRMGGQEVVSQIYAAVRDHNWGTVPGTLHDVQIEVQHDSFSILFRSDHQQNDIKFVWQGAIQGNADGTIEFSMHGEAQTTFRRNRIGFCILHPMELAGRSCRIEHDDGSQRQGVFPIRISPDQPFLNMRAIIQEVVPGVELETRFEGDVFEMEDQRNWTDASYKTYCTPLSLPFPVTIEAGTRVSQSVVLRLKGTQIPQSIARTSDGLIFRIETERQPLPQIGLGMASHDRSLAESDISKLRHLHPAHLRVDLWLGRDNVRERLQRAKRESQALDTWIEVAAFVSDNADVELSDLRNMLEESKPPISRWLVFHQHEFTTPGKLVEQARHYVEDYDTSAKFGGGTDFFFAQLNRGNIPTDLLDFLVFSINPQVHAFDNQSLVETLAAQAVAVENAQVLSRGLPLSISPVTLKMRRRPDRTGPATAVDPGTLPRQVDPRQMSLFGAGWTLGSIKYLGESGVQSITVYETSGWRGIIETNEGSPLPEQFVSIPGSVFPMYHVLADINEFAGGHIIKSISSNKRSVDGLVLEKSGKRRILLTNFNSTNVTIRLPDVSGTFKVSSLDETSFALAVQEPHVYRAQEGQLQTRHDTEQGLSMTLMPYATIKIDWTSPDLVESRNS